MLPAKPQPESLHAIRLSGCGFVRASDSVPELDEKPRETAHAASRYANEMNPVVFTGQKSRQIGQRLPSTKFFGCRAGGRGNCFRRELHESHIFPSCSPRSQLHLWARAARNSRLFVRDAGGFELARGSYVPAI